VSAAHDSLPPLELSAAGLARRRALNRTMEVIASLTAVIGVAILVVIVWTVAKRGAPALNLDLLTKTPIPFSFTNAPTGLANAFVGTLIIVGIATAMALPTGIAVALYLNEFARPSIRNAVGLVLDVLNGIPAIVIGIFVFGLIVVGHGQSAFAGAFALACMMLPLVARSTQEILVLVPDSTREASLGLGVPRWRTTLSVVLPQTIGGIVTGTTLAVARIAGETAPLLFTSSIVGTKVETNPAHAVWSVPVAIFEYSESPNPSDHAQAWAAALVLLVFILVASMSARALASRSKKKMGLSR
jgi:phosphate transport system permease protein